MSLATDALAVLLARRRDLYSELRLMDGHVAAVQNSAFFSTPAGNAATMSDSIERVEAQIDNINRQIAHIRGRPADKAWTAVDLG